MKEEVLLKEFEAVSAGGINHESPVVINFTQAKKNQRITKLKGDQGTNKTSTLKALMQLMGVVFDIKELVNKSDNALKTGLKFTSDGVDYEVIQSGPRLTLKRFYKEAQKWMAESEPKTTLRKIFGNIGISPAMLKDMRGDKQIAWFKETFGASEDVTRKEMKLQKQLVEMIDTRKEVNRSIKELDGFLNQSDLYLNYESSQKKFAKKVTAEKEKEAFESALQKKNEYEKNKRGLEGVQLLMDEHAIKLDQLRQQLKDAEEKEIQLQQRINDGTKWLLDNKVVLTDYDKANKAWLNLSQLLTEQTQWNVVLQKEKELQAAQDTVIIANGTVDQLRKELLDLTSTYLPKIEGLEIRVKGLNIDNGNDDEGIYYQGKSLAQLSESEHDDLWLQIWEQKDVEFVFIENVSSFGSGFIKRLNDMVKAGKIRVFASEMDRKKKEMEITFEAKIE